MTDARTTDAPEPSHFSVTYTEAELRDVGKLIAKRQARAESDYTFFGMLFVVPLAIGFAVYGAFALGLMPRAAVPGALAAAYIAFVAGWLSYSLWIRSYYRKHTRMPQYLGPWNYVFDDNGIVYKSNTTEVRFTWHGVTSVTDLRRIVLLLCGAHWVFIPARMFADNAARTAFAAACAARIKAAAETAQP